MRGQPRPRVIADAISRPAQDCGPAEAIARAVLAHLVARVRVDNAGVSAVPDWFVRLDSLDVDHDACPNAKVCGDVAAALRYIAELHIVATRAWRERDGALRGAQRALLAQRDATDALALAICHCWRAPMLARMAAAEAPLPRCSVIW